MAYLSQLASTLQNIRQTLTSCDISGLGLYLNILSIFDSWVYTIVYVSVTINVSLLLLAKVCVRYASKKASSSTRIKPGHPRPKHRGWKVQDGHNVHRGHILATQLKARFHPGLNVSIDHHID